MQVRDPLTHRILASCTHAAAEAGLYGQGRYPCPQFADTFLEQNNGYIGLVWRGKELLCIFPNYAGCIARSRPASSGEYAGLRAELEGIGYALRIRGGRGRAGC